MSTLKLEFVISAIDNATKKVRDVNEAVKKSSAPLRAAQDAARAFFKEAGWEKLQAQVARVTERGKALAGTVRSYALGFAAITAAAGATFFALKRNIDVFDHLNDVSQRLDVPIEKLQQMGYAAQLNGSDTNELTEALERLAMSQASALSGNKEMQIWFQRVGITMQALKGMKVDQVWEAIGDKFQAVGDAGVNVQKKLELLNAMTGRSSRGLVQLANLGGKGMRELYAEAARLGVVIDGPTAQAMANFNDNFDRLSFSTRAVMATIAKYALPGLDQMVRKFTQMNGQGQTSWAQRMGQALSDLLPKLPGFLAVLGQLSGAMVWAFEKADALARAIGGWGTVFNIVGSLLALKLIVQLVMFGVSVAQAASSVVAFARLVLPFFAGLASTLALPVLLVGALAAAFVAAGVLIYKYWDPISKFFSALWDKITSVASAAGKWVIGWQGLAGGGSAAPVAVAPAGGGRSQIGGTLKVELADGLRARSVSKVPGSPLDVNVFSGMPMVLP